jgi:hypothetical protein
MTSKIFSFRVLLFSLLLMTMIRADSLYAPSLTDGQSREPTSAAGSTQQAATDVKGKWSGTFFSEDSSVAPFTITVVINPDSRGHLVGDSTLDSDCLKGAKLEVTVTGSEVVLAGSNKEGDNMTVRGTLDTTGTVLTSTYILNGSATGGCETDNGTGTLAKQ